MASMMAATACPSALCLQPARSSGNGRPRCSKSLIVSASSSERQGRRQALGLAAGAAALCLLPPALQPPPAAAAEFVQTPSGLLVQDISVGTGRLPQPGDTCVVHWAGYTKNYQAKRIENTSQRDEPFEFKLGGGQVIRAFDEAVAGMRIGGIRRVEVLGELPELSYPRNRTQRFESGGGYRYRLGPQPSDLGGQRALDFVLDNQTLSPTNRTLLLDIKLLAVRPGRT